MSDRLNGGCEIHFAATDAGLWGAWCSAEEVVEPLVGHLHRILEPEVVEVEPIGTIVFDVDQVLADQPSYLGSP